MYALGLFLKIFIHQFISKEALVRSLVILMAKGEVLFVLLAFENNFNAIYMAKTQYNNSTTFIGFFVLLLTKCSKIDLSDYWNLIENHILQDS
jgi:hypothetical protein